MHSALSAFLKHTFSLTSSPKDLKLLISTWPYVWSSQVLVDRLAENPETGHDFVPVQVTTLEVPEPLQPADVALSAVKQTPVIKGYDVT